MKTRHVTPVYVDCRGCGATESVWKAMMATLELRFKLSEIDYFYNWINSHEQRLLLLFDNLALPFSEDGKISELLDNLTMNIKNVRVLCTCDRYFFRGTTSHEMYRVGDVHNESDAIMSMMTPDLHEEGIHQLVKAVDHILIGLMICGKAFSIEDVDSGKLFEDLTSGELADLLPAKFDDALIEAADDKADQQKLTLLAACIRAVIGYFQPKVKDMLVKLSPVSSFNLKSAADLSGLPTDQVEHAVEELVSCYLLMAVTKHGGRFYIPKPVRLVLDTCWPDNGTHSQNYVAHFISVLKDLCAQYHSKDCREALDAVDAEFDNIIDSLCRVLEHEDALELCADFATPEFAMFLYEIIPRTLFEDLYDSLVDQAGEAAQWTTQMYALCGLAYMHTIEKELDLAKVCAERAYVVAQQHQLGSQHKAYCTLCLGKVYWHENDDRDKAVSLVKQALDVLKLSLGLRHVRTLYVNEFYGHILTSRGSFQSARHVYNLSDFVVRETLDCHPLLLDGYNCRRAIWDKLCLFARATDVAEKAAETARLYLGEHPMTAGVLMSQSDAVTRRGSLNTALRTAITALGIRLRVLDNSAEETASNYRAVAALMLRSGQYDEAVRFGQSAIDIYDKLDKIDDRMRVEVKNMIAQARFRLECKATRYVEIESRDASKKNVADDVSTSMVSSISTEV